VWWAVVYFRAAPDLTISYLAGAGPGQIRLIGTQIQPELDPENLFLDHRTIRLMKLMASTMLSRAIKKQYSSVLSCFLHYFTVCQFLTKFAMNFVFL